MADDFQMKILSLMSEYDLEPKQEGNSFYFDKIPLEQFEELRDRITDAVVKAGRKVTISAFGSQIILSDLGGIR